MLLDSEMMSASIVRRRTRTETSLATNEPLESNECMQWREKRPFRLHLAGTLPTNHSIGTHRHHLTARWKADTLSMWYDHASRNQRPWVSCLEQKSVKEKQTVKWCRWWCPSELLSTLCLPANRLNLAQNWQECSRLTAALHYTTQTAPSH